MHKTLRRWWVASLHPYTKGVPIGRQISIQQPLLASAPRPQDHWGSTTAWKQERRGSSQVLKTNLWTWRGAAPKVTERSDAVCVKVASSLTFCAHSSWQSFSTSDKMKNQKQARQEGPLFRSQEGPLLGPFWNIVALRKSPKLGPQLLNLPPWLVIANTSWQPGPRTREAPPCLQKVCWFQVLKTNLWTWRGAAPNDRKISKCGNTFPAHCQILTGAKVQLFSG